MTLHSAIVPCYTKFKMVIRTDTIEDAARVQQVSKKTKNSTKSRAKTRTMAEPCEDGASTRSQDQDGSRATPQCGTKTEARVNKA